ncbi:MULTISPECIES: hypothetical protein [Streptomyces]|uniref:hypothetical protein n=1 Tax=Streptomyces TaxID=1883 RepID=UPI000C1AC465|nr:hypothetical protein [Streptomyces sp. STR69]
MRTFRKTVAVGGTMLSAAALVILPTTHANAASNCWSAQEYKRAPYFGQIYPVFYCNNLAGEPIHEFPDRGNVVGYMNSTTSWFLCRDDYGDFNGEWNPSHASRWIYTLADNGQWGFMNDKNISSETDPLTEC